MKKTPVDRPVSEHFCSLACEAAREPCDLCRAQRRTRATQKAQDEGTPSLSHKPFANLLRKDQK